MTFPSEYPFGSPDPLPVMIAATKNSLASRCPRQKKTFDTIARLKLRGYCRLREQPATTWLHTRNIFDAYYTVPSATASRCVRVHRLVAHLVTQEPILKSQTAVSIWFTDPHRYEHLEALLRNTKHLLYSIKHASQLTGEGQMPLNNIKTRYVLSTDRS